MSLGLSLGFVSVWMGLLEFGLVLVWILFSFSFLNLSFFIVEDRIMESLVQVFIYSFFFFRSLVRSFISFLPFGLLFFFCFFFFSFVLFFFLFLCCFVVVSFYRW